MRSKNEAGAAAVMSFLVPGLGQIFNGQIGKGFIFIGLTILSVVLCLFVIGIPMLIAVWIISIFDAYAGGEKKQRQNKYVRKFSTAENMNDLYGGSNVRQDAANARFFPEE